MTRAEAIRRLTIILRDNAESPNGPILLFAADRDALALAIAALVGVLTEKATPSTNCTPKTPPRTDQTQKNTTSDNNNNQENTI